LKALPLSLPQDDCGRGSRLHRRHEQDNDEHDIEHSLQRGVTAQATASCCCNSGAVAMGLQMQLKLGEFAEVKRSSLP
jgi:hypothetical protein